MSRRSKKRKKQKQELTELSQFQALQQEILISEGAKSKEGVELVEIGPDIKIRFPEIGELKIEQNKEEKGLYYLYLVRPGGSLSVWSEDDGRQKIVAIGKKDYLISNNLLIEAKAPGILDLFYREVAGGEQLQLEEEGGVVIIDLMKLRENEQVNEFLKQ